ncbi:MAG: phosphatidylserine decarboxylase [Candidatus Methylomirabilaceae bacterium]
MMPIAREGWVFISGPLALSAILWGAGWHAVGAAALAVALMLAFFFRDPRRQVPEGEGLILAPADGTIVAVTRYPGDELQEEATQLSIFLSVLDVHVNRAPVATVVERVDYRPGSFRLAWKDVASAANEQNLIFLKTAGGRLLVKQIAGFLARRIVCRVAPGQRLRTGERIGIILFGSRVDLILPASAKLSVKPGDRVKGGSSVVGVLS